MSRCVVVVVNRPAYRIALEALFGLTFGHVEFHARATHKVLRACRLDVDTMLALQGGPIHAMSDLITDPAALRRHSKFMALMGFKPLANIPCIDGIDRPLYLRET